MIKHLLSNSFCRSGIQEQLSGSFSSDSLMSYNRGFGWGCRHPKDWWGRTCFQAYSRGSWHVSEGPLSSSPPRNLPQAASWHGSWLVPQWAIQRAAREPPRWKPQLFTTSSQNWHPITSAVFCLLEVSQWAQTILSRETLHKRVDSRRHRSWCVVGGGTWETLNSPSSGPQCKIYLLPPRTSKFSNFTISTQNPESHHLNQVQVWMRSLKYNPSSTTPQKKFISLPSVELESKGHKWWEYRNEQSKKYSSFLGACSLF